MLGEVFADFGDLGLRSASCLEVFEGFFVDGEEADGCTVFWGHVTDGGSIGDCEVSDARSEELYKLINDAFFAKEFSAEEDEVGCCGVGWELADEFEADYLGENHYCAFAEHYCLGFDAADSPA